jgi:hypothetical protein
VRIKSRGESAREFQSTEESSFEFEGDSEEARTTLQEDSGATLASIDLNGIQEKPKSKQKKSDTCPNEGPRFLQNSDTVCPLSEEYVAMVLTGGSYTYFTISDIEIR